MKLEVRIGPRTHTVELVAEEVRATSIKRPRGPLRVRIDGRLVEADAVEVSPGTYSILLDGRSFEVRVEAVPDGVSIFVGGHQFAAAVFDSRAWRRRHGGVVEVEGLEQVIAPMPGKVVRLLVAAGETVEVGQGLLVVEAMKMQNEICAPKSGKVERLLVGEGQAVNAGEVLAVVA